MEGYGLMLIIAEEEILKGNGLGPTRCGGLQYLARTECKEEADDCYMSEGVVAAVVWQGSGQPM
jgi:hypothetical protein